MQSTRTWTLAAVVIIAAVLAGSWFIGISPKLDEAATADADRANVETQNGIHQARITSLKLQSTRLEEFQAELDELHRSVPEQANLSGFIGQVNAMAAQWGVSVTTFTAGDPVVFVAPVELPANPEVAEALSGIVPDTLLTIPVGINLEGEYTAVLGFVNQLQLGDRLFLVNGLNLGDGGAVTGEPVGYSLTGQIFVLVDAPPPPPAEEPAEAETGE